MKEQLLPALFLITAFYGVYRFHKWQQSLPQARECRNYNSIYAGVHAIEEITEQIEALEEIITDLNTCNSEAMKSIKLSVPSALKCNEYTILSDGSDFSSKQLLAIAHSERDRKREMLIKAIAELHNNGEIKNRYNIQEAEHDTETD